MGKVNILRMNAWHRTTGEQHVFYGMRIEDLPVALRDRGYDLAIQPLMVDVDDPRHGDAVTVSFFAIIRGLRVNS